MKKLNPLKAIVYLAAAFTLLIVVFIIAYILYQGMPQIIIEVKSLFQGGDSIFQWKYNSDNVSLVPAIMNTLIMVGVSLAISAVLGIGTAIYLVEYAKSGNKFVELIRITSETLSGIPSIIYGLFGMIFFVTYVGLGFSLLSGILTVSIMILPLIIRSTEEALKAVPVSYREASFGLGAAKLRTIIVIILPSAMNGIMAGVILAIGRVIGETAALIYTSGISTSGGVAIDFTNVGGRTLAVHMYMLTSEGLHIDQAYATAAVLLIVVVGLNAISYALAKRLTKGK
ncbi:MAG: phosphate ABC transporter permease PstA [Eubacteriales bacterium]